MGVFKDLGEINRWVRHKQVIVPRAEHQARYEQLYRIYLGLYRQTGGLMRDLAACQGAR